MQKSDVSVIICAAYNDAAREKSVQRLLGQLCSQTMPPAETLLVRGYKPRTYAHNIGARSATGKTLVFFDDDVQLSSNNVLEALVQALVEDPGVGIAGLRIVAPQQQNWFQRVCARQLLVAQNMVSHAALAIRASQYAACGGEDDRLYVNDDAWLNFQTKQQGLRVVYADFPHHVIHPEVADIGTFLRKAFGQGRMQAHDYRIAPEAILDAPRRAGAHVRSSTVSGQIVRNFRILGRALLHGQWLLLLGRLATAAGFLSDLLVRTPTIHVEGVVERYVPVGDVQGVTMYKSI